MTSGSVEYAVDLSRNVENIHMGVNGAQVFTASMDIDIKTKVPWLRLLPSLNYCSSSYGLLKQVVKPFAIYCAMSVTHELPKTNAIDIAIQHIDACVDSVSGQIIIDLSQVFSTTISDKVRYLLYHMRIVMFNAACQTVSQANKRSV